MIILSHLELLRKFNPKLNSSILMEIVIVNVVFLHLYPIKAGNISKEDGGISKVYYFNLMVSYLYSFNPFISINEIGKYLSRSIV